MRVTGFESPHAPMYHLEPLQRKMLMLRTLIRKGMNHFDNSNTMPQKHSVWRVEFQSYINMEIGIMVRMYYD